MKRYFITLFAVLSLISASGCSTLADAKAAKGKGTVRVYEQPYDAVWATVLAVVKDTSLALVSESKAEGVILAQGGMGAFSYGENVAIYVEDVGGKIKTRVEVISKRAMATNFTAANWESRLSAALDKKFNPEAK
jgi:hypothetical protein